MKIIIIGSPGAGKSVLTRRINEFLNYPVLHLDKVYHTGGKSHISREKLIEKVIQFTNKNENWIIDGNYISTLEMRIKLADTIIVLNISPEICLQNAKKRSEENIKSGKNRNDMADGFDETITDEFREFIINFNKDTMPRIEEILSRYKDKTIEKINNYEEIEELVLNLKNKLA
ncbi:MAG: topology modulation protein [Clostridiales bacterium GWE2_32_10]|nr:MAG: topology modulation protein [Clostridiales bacterium GWE2_32_10]HBY21334.1 topology modulation protein [Clostridiales bacterium]